MLWRYSKPKITPAKIKRTFSYSDFAYYVPLFEQSSMNESKSPPGAIGQK